MLADRSSALCLEGGCETVAVRSMGLISDGGSMSHWCPVIEALRVWV